MIDQLCNRVTAAFLSHLFYIKYILFMYFEIFIYNKYIDLEIESI